MLVQKCYGGHDLTGLAIPALRGLLGNPGFLHDVEGVWIFCKSFNGGDRFPLGTDRGSDAGADGLPVQMNRAGPALGDSAPKLSSSQSTLFSDSPE